MKFDHVEGIVNWFDLFDLGKFHVNICLNVWTHEFQKFVEKWMTIFNSFISLRVHPLVCILVDFDLSLGFRCKQSHDLVWKNWGFPAFHEFLFANVSKWVRADAITSPHSIVIYLICLVEEIAQLQVPHTSFAFFAMRSSEALSQVLIMLTWPL